MEMMTMMMDLDKLPDPFSHPFQDYSQSPSSIMDLNFSGESSSTNHRAPPTYLQQQQPSIYPTHNHFPRASWFYQKPDSVEAMREMIFQMAALQPVQIDPESVKPPKRRNVKISKDPLSVAARHRRERISERIRILQRLVPGGTKMDTASMLDEAVHYMKFLKKQVESLEQATNVASGRSQYDDNVDEQSCRIPLTTNTMSQYGANNNYAIRACGESSGYMVGSMELLR